MDPNKIAQNLAIKIKPYQVKIELGLISMIAIGILLKKSEIGNALIVISFSTLSILYYIMAFRLSPPENNTTIFLNKLIQISLSVAMIGILFTIQHYMGAAIMLRISIITMFIGLIFTFITKLKNKELQDFVDADTIRIVVLTLLITSFIVFGKSDFIFHPDNNEKQEINKEVHRDSLNHVN